MSRSRRPKLSELNFVKDRVESSQSLALALANTAEVLHRGMEHTRALFDQYDQELVLRAELLTEVGHRLFRLADRGDARDMSKKGVLAELDGLRAWFAEHWKDGELLKAQVDRE